MTRCLLLATLVIGIARLLLAIPAGSPPSFAAALEMRDHLAREGIIEGIKCVSCTKPDFGGIRYLPREHKDSHWSHLRRVHEAALARLGPVDYLQPTPCTLGFGRSEVILEFLYRSAPAEEARD